MAQKQQQMSRQICMRYICKHNVYRFNSNCDKQYLAFPVTLLVYNH